jgi:hypothetical protein
MVWNMVRGSLKKGDCSRKVQPVLFPQIGNVEDNPLIHVHILHREVEPEPEITTTLLCRHKLFYLCTALQTVVHLCIPKID